MTSDGDVSLPPHTYSSDSVEQQSKLTPFERTYRGILRGIYEGRFVPGQRLIAPDLMQQFEVGRGTIREVLHRLASSGIVSIVPNRGAAVRKLTRREVYEVLDLVGVLLGLAARGASIRMEAGDHDRLRALHEDLQSHDPAAAFAEFLSIRERYYRFVVQLAGNRELQRVFPDAQVHIMRLQLRMFGRAADSIAPDDFADLTAAILSGNPDVAEAAGRRHVEFTRVRIAGLPDRAFLSEA